MKKKILLLTVAVAVLFLGAVFFFQLNGRASSPTYRTSSVERGDISVIVSATGTLNAVTVVQVGSQVSGSIARLFADFNSVVRKGQVIVIIDTTFLWASVRDAEANLDRAKAQVGKTERDLERSKPLFEKNLLSQADNDAAVTFYEQANAELKSAQAQLDRAGINLKYATIRSPIDGVVLSRNVDVGQTVAASFSAPTLFTIANDLTKMQVEAKVDEADIGNVHVRQSVKFSVDAYPDKQFEGTVSQVRLQPQMQDNVVNYTVIVEVPNPDFQLMPGMTATLFILVEERQNVLKVSNLALRFRSPEDDPNFSKALADTAAETPGGEQRGRRGTALSRSDGRGITGSNQGSGSVWVLRQGKPAFVSLRTGITDGSYSEVLHGDLKEGDQVILSLSQGGAAASNSSNPFQPQPVQGGRRRSF